MSSLSLDPRALLVKQSLLLAMLDVLREHQPFDELGITLHEVCGESAWICDDSLQALHAGLLLAEPTRIAAAQQRVIASLGRDANQGNAGSTLIAFGALSAAARGHVNYVARTAREAAAIDGALDGFPVLEELSWSVAWPAGLTELAEQVGSAEVLVLDSSGRWADALIEMHALLETAHARGIPTMAVWHGDQRASRELLARLALGHRVIVSEGEGYSIWFTGLEAAVADHLGPVIDEELAALSRAVETSAVP